MFRLQNNVPEVYADRSRDFQLFCRLYDSAFGCVKYSIDSLQRSTSTKECDSSLLELLKTKLGLFTSTEVDDRELRFILQAFPTIIRYKGSKKAIDYVLTLYSRITNILENFASYDVLTLETEHKLILNFNELLSDDRLLTELLRYILPTGYIIEYRHIKTSEYSSESYVNNDKLEYVTVKKDDISKYSKVKRIVDSENQLRDEQDKAELPRTVGLTRIDNYKKDIQEDNDQ